MKSIKSELPPSETLAPRGCMLLFVERGSGGTGGASLPLVIMLLDRSPLGSDVVELDAPWICAERRECNDAEEALGRIGRTASSLFGPVDLMKSAKS